MFVPSAYQDLVNDPNNPVRECLEASNVFDWNNRTSTALYYCTADEQVDFQNSIVAEDAMDDNIPWYLFWIRAIITSINLGNLSHFDCVIPYGIVSKLQFDLYQSGCNAGRGMDEVATILRPINYNYIDIQSGLLYRKHNRGSLLGL